MAKQPEEDGAVTDSDKLVLDRLIDHIITSGNVVTSLDGKINAVKEELEKIPNAIAAEGRSKCDACPARNDMLRLVLKYLEGPLKQSSESNRFRIESSKPSLLSIIFSIVSNKYLWIAISLIAVVILALAGFDVIQLLK